jgi:hypothetical protein
MLFVACVGNLQAFLRQALCSCTVPVYLYNSAAAPAGQSISPELYKALAADFHHIVAGIHHASSSSSSNSSSSSSSSGSDNAAALLDLPRRYKAAVPHLPVHVSATSSGALHTLLTAAGAAEASSSSSCSEQVKFHIICAAASVAPEAFTRLSEAVARRDAPAAASAESRLRAWCSYANRLSAAATGTSINSSSSISSSSSSSSSSDESTAAGNIAILKAGVAARVPGFGTGTRAPIVPLSSVQAQRVLQWFADDGLGKAELSDKVSRASQSFKAKVDAYTAGWNSVEVAALEALTAKVS